MSRKIIESFPFDFNVFDVVMKEIFEENKQEEEDNQE